MTEGKGCKMQKLILILLDGLSYETAVTRMAFLQHLTERGRASLHKIIAELPSMSRPLYETCLTGLPPCEHGVVSNDIVRRSACKNLFSHARANGLKTAAAAYHWISELYVDAPFQPAKDRFLINDNADIQRGIFYWEDSYPDNHLYADAEHLRRSFAPDFLLVHPMGIDHAGHEMGGASAGYRAAAQDSDHALSRVLPAWLADGYTVLVTADHGMNPDGGHGGTLPCEREVPLWVLGYDANLPNVLRQTALAPYIAHMLGLPPLFGEDKQ